MSTPEAISQRDAAAELGISRATVERWVNQGRLNTVRTGARGGARRVLVDETFRAAKNTSPKIPHSTRSPARKSLTDQNSSARESGQPPHTQAVPSAGSTTKPLTGSADKTRLDAPEATVLPESLAPDAQESLTRGIEESLTDAGADAMRNAPPAAPRSERLRHPLDADLVPLTSSISHDAGPRGVARTRPARARAALAILVVALVAAAALAIYAPWHQARRTETAPTRQSAGARGAQAQATVSARDRAAAIPARQPRGGHARPIATRTTTPPAKRTTSTTPARSVPAPSTQTTTSASADRQHRPHPITPCQSSGICVPD
jgi:excisionase family DNA binding protein